MKKLRLPFMAMLLLGAVACRKASTTVPAYTGNVSSAEAADMVAGSLSLSSNGVANVAGDATLSATNMASTNAACGTTRADTISRTNAPGSADTYNYHSTYNYTVTCDSTNHPANLSSTLVYSGSFSGPHLSSTNSGSSIFTVAGLSPATTDFVINGEYKRSGSFQSKVDSTNAGNSTVDIMISALTLKKPFRTIVSGSAAISITGDVPRKGNFSYTGTLVFNGDGTATLTINGTVYHINLTTGARY